MQKIFSFILILLMCFSWVEVGPVQADPPTTIEVNKQNDTNDAHPGDGYCDDGSGQTYTCSLRAALQEVNALPVGNYVVDVPAGTYILSLSGSLNLNKPVTITNNTENLVQIRGLETNGSTINVQADVTLNYITLIFFDTALTVAKESTLTCNHCVIEYNKRGINVDGFYGGNPQVNLNYSIVRNNEGSDCVAALIESGTSLYAFQSSFQDNKHIHSDTLRGGAVCNDGGNLTLDTSQISGNNSGANPDPRIVGGGLYQTKGNTLITWNSAIDGNRASEGGGIYVLGGTLTIKRDSEVFNNLSAMGYGGGISLGAKDPPINLDVILDHVLIYNNLSESGGGINHGYGSLTITNSAIFNNQAIKTGWINVEKGAGLYSSVFDASASPLVISNTTISGNNAHNAGGGLYLKGVNAQLSNLTITNNTCDANANEPGVTGGGMYIDSTASVTMRNSILAGNSDPAGTTRAHDISGTLISDGNNLIGECNVLFCTVSGNLTGNLKGSPSTPINPKLAALVEENDLHYTWYHPMDADSPAVNAGNINGCRDQAGELLPTDQLGKMRAAWYRCDMGAFESPHNSIIPKALIFLPSVIR